MMSPSAWSLMTPQFDEAPAAPGLVRAERRARRPRSADEAVTIRRARAGDEAALADLAALDAARPLRGEALVAEHDGRPVAALELDSGRAVADPFRRSAAAVALLGVRAEQLRAASGAGASRGRLLGLAPRRRTRVAGLGR